MMLRKDRTPEPVVTPDPVSLMFGGLRAALQPLMADLTRNLLPIAVTMALIAGLLGGLLGGLLAVVLS